MRHFYLSFIRQLKQNFLWQKLENSIRALKIMAHVFKKLAISTHAIIISWHSQYFIWFFIFIFWCRNSNLTSIDQKFLEGCFLGKILLHLSLN